MNKKLGSKLVDGVRQVKAQRAPLKNAQAAKPAPVAAKPAVTRVGKAPAKSSDSLHPPRVWPD